MPKKSPKIKVRAIDNDDLEGEDEAQNQQCASAKKSEQRRNLELLKEVTEELENNPVTGDLFIDKALLLIASGLSNKRVADVLGTTEIKITRMFLGAQDFIKDQYHEARKMGIEAEVSSMNDIVTDEWDVQKAKLKIENIKWKSSKWLPNKYGNVDKPGGQLGGGTTVVLDFSKHPEGSNRYPNAITLNNNGENKYEQLQ